MTKDDALKIVCVDSRYYLHSLANKNGEMVISKIYGPFEEKEAEYVKSLSKRSRDRYSKRAMVLAAKPEVCPDCGETKSKQQMSFDHVKGKKHFDLGSASGKTRKQITLELEKCEAVCMICHRIREFNRGRNRLIRVEDLAQLLLKFV